MQIIPTLAVPNQQLSIQLAGQACKLTVWTKSTGMFVDLYTNDVLLLGGMLARNAVLMVRNVYFGFVGDLTFFDTQGKSDPVYTGIGPGGRWFLAYLELADLPNDYQ